MRNHKANLYSNTSSKLIFHSLSTNHHSPIKIAYVHDVKKDK